jgi:type I restriction enzyme, S subunit
MRDSWKALPLGDVVEHTIGGVWGGESGTDEVEVTVVRSTEFTKRGYLNFETGVSRSIKHSQLKSRELKVGDILLEKSGGGPDQPVGRVVYVTREIPNKFVCSNFVQLIRPNSKIVEPLFLFHIMWRWHAINRTLEFQAQTTGIRNLRTPDYLEQEINLPTLPEQKRIVDLISSIDAYIEALQHQFERAKRSRNAVLHELLTAGGDEWVETTLGEVAEVIGGGTPSTTIGEYWEGDIVWLTPTEITSQDGKVVSDSIRKITDLGFKNSGAQMLPRDSVILTSRASVGFVALAGKELCTNQGFQSLIPKPSVLSKFLMFWIQQNRSEFESRSAGSTFKEISKSNVKSIKLQLPPLSEQKRIVEIVNTIDEVISQTELTTSKAKNLRSGLLSDLLSGEHEIPTSYDKVIGAAL